MNKTIESTKKSLKMLGLLFPMVLAMPCFANDYDDEQMAEEPQAPKSFYQKLENFYIFGNSGVSNAIVSSNGVKFSPQYTGGGGIGYYFNDLIRADFNVSYRKSEVRSNSTPNDFKTVKNISYLWNLYLNLTDREDRFVPYLTAGLGYGINKVENRSIINGSNTYAVNSQNRGNFVWNTGVGGILRMSNMMGLDFGYRYIDLGKINYSSGRVGGSTTYNTRTMQAHELTLGLMFKL
jgi:opacity protein-like surface antigen